METQLRALLYSQLEGHTLAFNPVEPEPFDLVDLSKDVTNATRIYHLRTECVREALEGATLIVADSEPLAQVVSQVLPAVAVAALPFGHFQGWVTPHERDSEALPVIGLLNHDGATEMNNAYALKLLKALDRPLLIFGRALLGIEVTVEEDFGQFAAKCDILLLPSLPGVINSITVPLALMETGTTVLASGAPGYWNLDAATGVQLLPFDPAAWRNMLDLLASQPAKLRAMQERNRAFAVRTNQESLSRLPSLLPLTPARLVARPSGHSEASPARKTASKDCGCGKKRRSAPTQPDLDQPIIEKEIVQK